VVPAREPCPPEISSIGICSSAFFCIIHLAGTFATDCRRASHFPYFWPADYPSASAGGFSVPSQRRRSLGLEVGTTFPSGSTLSAGLLLTPDLALPSPVRPSSSLERLPPAADCLCCLSQPTRLVRPPTSTPPSPAGYHFPLDHPSASLLFVSLRRPPRAQ